MAALGCRLADGEFMARSKHAPKYVAVHPSQEDRRRDNEREQAVVTRREEGMKGNNVDDHGCEQRDREGDESVAEQERAGQYFGAFDEWKHITRRRQRAHEGTRVRSKRGRGQKM